MAEEVRFFDNRQRYLLFVTTTNEKAVIAEKLSHLINELKPVKPALKIFDAGVGDGAVLMNVLRICLLYTSPSPRDRQKSRMPSSA